MKKCCQLMMHLASSFLMAWLDFVTAMDPQNMYCIDIGITKAGFTLHNIENLHARINHCGRFSLLALILNFCNFVSGSVSIPFVILDPLLCQIQTCNCATHLPAFFCANRKSKHSDQSHNIQKHAQYRGRGGNRYVKGDLLSFGYLLLDDTFPLLTIG